MKITVVCVGKLKERYLVEGVAEYVKRLTPFTRVEFREINEERMPLEPSDAEREQVLEKESQRLIESLPDKSYVILLDLVGKEISSPELALKFNELMVSGVSHITFVIGGAFGYTDALRKKADFCWSFSPLTFTHQMIRMMLVEQIYRAFKIMRGEKYHW